MVKQIGKKNKGSLWIKTVTALGPPNMLEQEENTYPIALGPKKVSHEVVEKIFAEDMEIPSKENAYYSRIFGKEINVMSKVIATLQDQPERRSCNHLMLGRSDYAGRWGYSCNFKKIKHQLPACKNCYDLLRSNTKNWNIKCQSCLCWDTTENHRLLKYEAPPKFPKEDTTKERNDDGYLRPFKLTYTISKTSVQK